MINIVLYQPEIPPNTGTIARTCAITGIKLHLIKPLGFSIDDKAVKRAGLDYWHLLDLEVHESVEDFLDKYGEEDIYLATTKTNKFYTDVKYTENSFIMFGKETAGLPAWLHEKYKGKEITIPMKSHPDVRSLNLSNSVNIVAFEALRQLDFPGLK
ncbi:tRNA (cytidine(34)-2'-O)-methyltransferase [Acidaminobacter sp. JC074]|uniref:tRNA (cytidine(34)-2'-O)-methyltransferase n=1 Tax=Acidaminobacter sp. JC074 TaxID=2530199 RepID=UPI001F0D647B|nr:tRNA (cytidine(34)-2'-O)-methyltransferase [Acidaminobacter sp. JC074]MCH4889155.1 tRNA (cytidine(34)-2'-O)-methyltransferase [Acidaminobacter sp. JC074]